VGTAGKETHDADHRSSRGTVTAMGVRWHPISPVGPACLGAGQRRAVATWWSFPPGPEGLALLAGGRPPRRDRPLRPTIPMPGGGRPVSSICGGAIHRSDCMYWAGGVTEAGLLSGQHFAGPEVVDEIPRATSASPAAGCRRAMPLVATTVDASRRRSDRPRRRHRGRTTAGSTWRRRHHAPPELRRLVALHRFSSTPTTPNCTHSTTRR
jgi:hypothetical protein